MKVATLKDEIGTQIPWIIWLICTRCHIKVHTSTLFITIKTPVSNFFSIEERCFLDPHLPRKHTVKQYPKPYNRFEILFGSTKMYSERVAGLRSRCCFDTAAQPHNGHAVDHQHATARWRSTCCSLTKSIRNMHHSLSSSKTRGSIIYCLSDLRHGENEVYQPACDFG